VSVGALLLGRILLGCGESLVITGALGWAWASSVRAMPGKVMAWVGMAMFGAFAAGAPLGTLIYGRYEFIGIALATIIIPLLALGFVAPAAPVAVTAAKRVPFYKVLGTVWVPGLGVGLSCVGFGVVTTFIALLFAAKKLGKRLAGFHIFWCGRSLWRDCCSRICPIKSAAPRSRWCVS